MPRGPVACELRSQRSALGALIRGMRLAEIATRRPIGTVPILGGRGESSWCDSNDATR